MKINENNDVFIAYDSLVAPLGEAFVIRSRRKPGHEFMIVRATEDGLKNGVDIKEMWDDSNGHHEVWHEVKTDQRTTQGNKYPSAQVLYELLTVLDASPVKGGTGNIFLETKQWNKNRQWVKGWYPKYKKLLEMEDRQGIIRDRLFWYYTTTSGFIDVPNGGQRTPDAISHPDQEFPDHFNFAIQLPLRELINTVEEFAKPYGGVAKLVSSGLPPYREDKQRGTAGILMTITHIWRTPEDALRVFKDESIAKEDEIVNALLCNSLNALVNADKDNDYGMKSFHGNIASLLFDLKGRGTHLDFEGIPSALNAPASARLFIDAARSEERFRYDADFANGKSEYDDQISKYKGRDVNAEIMTAFGWRELDLNRGSESTS